MLYISLSINILVLIPVCYGIFVEANWIQSAYGPYSPALSILLSIYLAILSASMYLMLYPNVAEIHTLLALQVVYKFLTYMLVAESTANPVVLTNLAIAAFHSYTLYSTYNMQQ